VVNVWLKYMFQYLTLYLFLFISLALLFLSAFFLIFHLVATISGAPYAGSNRQRIKTMLKLASTQKGQKIVDLGSGDGRILIEAAKKHDVECVGYEINPLWYFVSLFKTRKSGVGSRVKIYRKSYWPVKLGDFDVIFLYLIPYNMKKMAKKLQRELKPGTLVVSNGFKFDDWPVIKEENGVYLYRINY